MAALGCVDPDPEQICAGTGCFFPTIFDPPSPSFSPASLFQEALTENGQTRFVNRQNPPQFLIYTDGACGDNGRLGARTGWAFVYGPCNNSDSARGQSIMGERLENKGPYDDRYPQTNNRAELRAVIAALSYRPWGHEMAMSSRRFNTLVIATDSEIVAKGATEWARRWISRGWRKPNGDDVMNKDLWICLLGQIERLYDQTGMRVKFWRIPREWNGIADAAAKLAAEKEIVGDSRFLNWVSSEQ